MIKDIQKLKDKAFSLSETLKKELRNMTRPKDWCSIHGCGNLGPWDPWDPWAPPEQPPIKPNPEPEGFPDYNGPTDPSDLYSYIEVEGGLGIIGFNQEYIKNNLGGIQPTDIILPRSHRGTPVVAIADDGSRRGAFENQPLDTVIIPSPIQRMEGVWANSRGGHFANCGIKKVTLNSDFVSFNSGKWGGVWEGGSAHFSGNLLEEVSIPPKVKAFPNRLFYDNLIENVNVYGNVNAIGDEAFMSNRLTDVSILLKDAIGIGNSAFMGNNISKLVYLPKKLEKYGTTAFAYNPLHEGITFTKNVDSVTGFYGCSLREIYVPGNIKSLTAGSNFGGITGGAFEGNKELQDVNLADGVELIGNSAFWGCNALRKIRIPDTVTKIVRSGLPYDANYTIYANEIKSLGDDFDEGIIRGLQLGSNVKFKPLEDY